MILIEGQIPLYVQGNGSESCSFPLFVAAGGLTAFFLCISVTF